ncbi:MAG: hypothetical protein KatS3mg131_0431 [Candidatus Tectimicrobiota bacterium]|nr:MAG: hypothetical protein KatS3mg131_0431 [Candidatus Tectomicrobia bacterium]
MAFAAAVSTPDLDALLAQSPAEAQLTYGGGRGPAPPLDPSPSL